MSYASLKKWIYGFYPRQMIECLIMMINNQMHMFFICEITVSKITKPPQKISKGQRISAVIITRMHSFPSKPSHFQSQQ